MAEDRRKAPEESGILEEIIKLVKKEMPNIPHAKVRDYCYVQPNNLSHMVVKHYKPSAGFTFDIRPGEIRYEVMVSFEEDFIVVESRNNVHRVNRSRAEMIDPEVLSKITDIVLKMLIHLSKVIKKGINEGILELKLDADRINARIRKKEGEILAIDQRLITKDEEKQNAGSH